MRKFSTRDTRSQFAEIVNQVAYGRERIVVTRRGKGLAAIVPLDDLKLLEQLEEVYDIKAAEEALNDPGNQKPIPWEELKKKMGL